MTTPADPPDYGPLQGLLIPTMTGVAASALVIAPWLLLDRDVAWIAAPLVLIGGAILIGIVVGNPDNEGMLLGGGRRRLGSP